MISASGIDLHSSVLRQKSIASVVMGKGTVCTKGDRDEFNLCPVGGINRLDDGGDVAFAHTFLEAVESSGQRQIVDDIAGLQGVIFCCVF